MTIKSILDYKNRIRNELDQVVQNAGQQLGNEIKGYTLVVWGNDADKPIVYYLKGGLTTGFLPQFTFDALSDAIEIETGVEAKDEDAEDA